jgi:hypothetical protein
MSAYYHAIDSLYPDQGIPGQGSMRNEFVGILFAVGALLFAYQGYSRLEDYALNLAGVLALETARIVFLFWRCKPRLLAAALPVVARVSRAPLQPTRLPPQKGRDGAGSSVVFLNLNPNLPFGRRSLEL